MTPAFTPRENLRRDVIRRAADGRLALVVAREATREAEVADLHPTAGGVQRVQLGVRPGTAAEGAAAADRWLYPGGGHGIARVVRDAQLVVVVLVASVVERLVRARGGEEDVAELEVAVDDLRSVQTRHRGDDLAEVRGGLGEESGPRRLTTSARVLSLQSSMRMYTFAASSKHRANRTTRPSRTARWMRISVRILARARGFSSVLLATTLAA